MLLPRNDPLEIHDKFCFALLEIDVETMSTKNRSESLKCVGDDAFEARGSCRSHEKRLIINKVTSDVNEPHGILILPAEGKNFAEEETKNERLSCNLTPEHMLSDMLRIPC